MRYKSAESRYYVDTLIWWIWSSQVILRKPWKIYLKYIHEMELKGVLRYQKEKLRLNCIALNQCIKKLIRLWTLIISLSKAFYVRLVCYALQIYINTKLYTIWLYNSKALYPQKAVEAVHQWRSRNVVVK